jgi:hypothetical protein
LNDEHIYRGQFPQEPEIRSLQSLQNLPQKSNPKNAIPLVFAAPARQYRASVPACFLLTLSETLTVQCRSPSTASR